MLVKNRRLGWLLALMTAFALVAAACGDGDEDTDAGGTASEDGDGSEGEGGGEVSGDIFISGSSTVEPVSVRVAEMFADVETGVNVDVEGPGTGDGFELFCSGETDISDAARPIKQEEVDACTDGGVEFIELKIAFDGIAVMTSPANDTVECLSFADVYALVGPASQGFSNWSDAQDLATQLGSQTVFPDAPLDITAPGEESGTYDSFVEIVLEGIAEDRGQEPGARADYSSQADDNAIIQGIEGSDSSLGWVGFAFAEEAGEGVKEIEISEEPGGECVAPTAESIADGSYPVARALYIYVNAAKADENPAIPAFIDFYLGDGLSAVEEVGYVSLPDDQIDETIAAWEDRTTGTREG
ncbi:hypothetical protein BH18ACT4_BH18ACT4_02130 [soil metagenome]